MYSRITIKVTVLGVEEKEVSSFYMFIVCFLWKLRDLGEDMGTLIRWSLKKKCPEFEAELKQEV